MAFDFRNMEAPDRKQDHLDGHGWEITYLNHFERYCDSLSQYDGINDQQQMKYLQDKGYFIADRFYMVNPYKYLGFDRHPCHNYFGNGCLFLYRTPADELKTISKKEIESLKIANLADGEGKTYRFDTSVITYIPVVIFQGNKNQNIGEGEYTYPDDRSKWTASDLVVFRGIFKIEEQANDPDKYSLTRLFDRYYFAIPKAK